MAERIAAVLEEQLKFEIAQIRPESLVSAAATALEASHNARLRAFECGPTRPREAAHQVQRLADDAFAVRALLELGLRNPANSSHRVDALSGPRLFGLAKQLVTAHMATARFSSRLSRLESIELLRDSAVQFTLADAPPFRMSRFDEATIARLSQAKPEHHDDNQAVMQLSAAADKGEPLPAELVDIDAGLREARGHGLIDLVATYWTLELLAAATGPDAAGG